MSTLHSLVAVYGAIDQLVLDDPTDRIPIAERYLPAYEEDQGGPGWFEDIVDLANRHTTEDTEAVSFPGLDGALTDLANPEERGLTLPEIGRLVFAVGMIVRLDPEGERASRDLLVAALVHATPNGSDAEAAELLDLLADDAIFPDRDAWKSMMSEAIERGVMRSDLLAISAPCNGGWDVLSDGQLVTRMTTHFTTTMVTLDAVKAVLDPLNWDDCCPFFCDMTALAPSPLGWSQVLEEVSDECATWRLRTGLKYWKFDLGAAGAVVNYDLCDVRPPGDDGTVIVDRGYILVKPVPGAGIEVRTSKQLLFDGPISGTSTSIFACIVGWANVGEDLIFGCAAQGEGSHQWEASSEPGSPRSRRRRMDPPPPPLGPPGLAGAAVDEMVDTLTTCVDEMSAKGAACAQQAAEGNLTADALVRSGADAAARMALEPLRILDGAARAGRAARTARTPRPRARPAEPETRAE